MGHVFQTRYYFVLISCSYKQNFRNSAWDGLDCTLLSVSQRNLKPSLAKYHDPEFFFIFLKQSLHKISSFLCSDYYSMLCGIPGHVSQKYLEFRYAATQVFVFG